MAAVYNWSVESVDARKVFTDKYGNVRQNAIKSVALVYTGKDGDREEKERTSVSFSLVDLSSFKPIDEITNQEILQWALNKLHPKERNRIEKYMKSRFENVDDESNMVNIVINE